MNEEAAYKLSRVYAEGWNAARKMSADECDGLDAEQMAALNPYASDAERTRWNEGFAKALGN